MTKIVGRMIHGALLALIVALLVAANASADRGAAAVRDYERKAAAPSTPLDRALRATCPSQPGAMTRARCVQWVQVGQCETGGQQRAVSLRSFRQIRWRYNGRSGFDGALQFKPSTWTSNVGRIPARKLTRYQRLQRRAGRYHHAWSAPPAVQVLAAEVLRLRPDSSGLGNWPSCGAWFPLRPTR